MLPAEQHETVLADQFELRRILEPGGVGPEPERGKLVPVVSPHGRGPVDMLRGRDRTGGGTALAHGHVGEVQSILLPPLQRLAGVRDFASADGGGEEHAGAGPNSARVVRADALFALAIKIDALDFRQLGGHEGQRHQSREHIYVHELALSFGLESIYSGYTPWVGKTNDRLKIYMGFSQETRSK